MIKYTARLLLGLLLTSGCVTGADSTNRTAAKWSASDYRRKTIYHAPEKPGYSSWVGVWIMSDKSLMVTFKQATTPAGGLSTEDERVIKDTRERVYTGLDLANVYLRSTDGGATWVKTAEDKFHGPSERPAWGGSHCGLSNGGILRAVDGSQLPSNNVPRLIFFQRSMDLGKTWGPAEIPPEPKRSVKDYLGDAGDCITRVRWLRDGRLLATGVARPDMSKRELGKPLFMFSADEGKTWQPLSVGLTPEQSDRWAWNEWDSAELPNGDFLCVFRRKDPTAKNKQERWQGLLLEKGGEWVIGKYRRAVFEHSGHPELLVTREGIILHIATSGIHWTDDAGDTWHPLDFKGQKAPYRSRYYPVSVQTKDGRIFVCSHSGGDNAYGQVDQAIVMDNFRLTKD